MSLWMGLGWDEMLKSIRKYHRNVPVMDMLTMADDRWGSLLR